MKKYWERLWNGLVKENPVLVLMLGMCPALAVSTQAANGIGMGLSTLAVLVLSNLVISLLRKVIPDQVRLPAYIVIVASLVTDKQTVIYQHGDDAAYTPENSRGFGPEEQGTGELDNDGDGAYEESEREVLNDLRPIGHHQDEEGGDIEHQ